MEIATARQLLRSPDPLLETSARNPPPPTSKKSLHELLQLGGWLLFVEISCRSFSLIFARFSFSPSLLGWHFCRTKLPRKVFFIPKRKMKRKVKRKVRKTPRNVPEKIQALFSCLKDFRCRHFFTVLHPQFQTRFQTQFKHFSEKSSRP